MADASEDPFARQRVVYADIARRLYPGANNAMGQAGFVAMNSVRQELSHPGTGRSYRRGGVVHVASAPGEPPAPDEGTLRRSYTYRVDTGDRDRPAVEVYSPLEYAAALEFGTSTIAARPHLRVGVAKALERMVAIARQHLLDAQRDTPGVR